MGSLNGFALRAPQGPEPQFLLYKIDVQPDRRNRGIGWALVEAFITEARAAGTFEVWVPTNQSNQAVPAAIRPLRLRREAHDDVMLSLKLPTE